MWTFTKGHVYIVAILDGKVFSRQESFILKVICKDLQRMVESLSKRKLKCKTALHVILVME